MGSRGVLVGLVVCAAVGHAQDGAISTIAGRTPVNGAPVRGFDGDGSAATNAALALANFVNTCDPNRFEQTSHISLDSKGNIYFADSNNQRIRRIDTAGVITTVVGSGDPPQTDSRCQQTGSVGDSGSALAARLFNPSDMIVHPNGNLIIADQQNNRIRQVTPTGLITTIAGSGLHNLFAPGVPATSSPMDWPSSLALDASGVLYFAELHGNRVGKIGSDGRMATAAGTGFPGYNGDRISATSAMLSKPAGIAIDRNGQLLIADTGNHRVRRVGSDGVITTIAGSGRQSFCGDGGSATDACLDTPMDVKTDALGNIYIADTGNHRVRRVDPTGVITTVAGTGDPGRGPDGVVATTSALNYPSALAVDGNNDLYIVDWQNYLIRKISFGATAISAGGVVNSASFAAPVAPGGMISIFGINMGSVTAVEVNGTSVPLLGMTSQQINAQLPYETSTGTASAVLVTDAGRTAPISFPVAAANVGVFAYAGTQRAVALNQDGTVNAPDNPETRGRAMVFYVTGVGAVTPALQTGDITPLDPLTQAVLTPTATVGGATANVFFAGLVAGYIGFGQINLTLPDGAATGDAVPVFFEVAGQRSNTVSVSIR